MKKKVATILLSLLAFFFYFNTIFAQVVFNEIQISPVADRFMELYNTGDLDIDLTGWYIQRKTATGSTFGSLITSPKFENKTIKTGEYFLISRSSLSNTDIIVDNLTLTDSNTLRLRNSKREDVDQIQWGSLSEGESYQKTASGWVSATPTPRTPNLVVGLPSGNNSENGDTKIQTKPSEQQQLPPPVTTVDKTWPVKPQIFTRIKIPSKVAMVGADVLIEGEALGLEKEPLEGARYLWTFGNGGSKEGQKVFYNYNYPGKYVVMLNTSSGIYSTSGRITIKVIPADIVISSVGTGSNSFVEVYNKTKYELNLSRWKLRSGNKLFDIPENTIILSNNKIVFPSQHTKFEIKKGEKVELLYPNSTPVYSYVWKPDVQAPVQIKKVTQTKKPKKITPSAKLGKDGPFQANIEKEKEEKKPEIGIVRENQSATVFTSSNDNSSIYKWLLAVSALVVISIVGVFFVDREERVTQGISKEADEYEILEDED